MLVSTSTESFRMAHSRLHGDIKCIVKQTVEKGKKIRWKYVQK